MNTRRICYQNAHVTVYNGSRCSYCKNVGHKINYCMDESIEKLDKIGENTIVIGYLIFGLNERSIYTRMWLNNLNHKEIQVLGYKYGYGNNSYEFIYDNINTLIQIYDKRMMSNSHNFKILILGMDRNIINHFIEVIKQYYNHYEIEQIKNKIKYYRTYVRYPIKTISMENIKNDEECPICMNEIDYLNTIKTECEHTFCSDCLINYMNTNTRSIVSCPMCRHNIKQISLHHTNQNKNVIETFCSNELYQQEQSRMLRPPETSLQHNIPVPVPVPDQIQDDYSKIILILYECKNYMINFIICIVMCMIVLSTCRLNNIISI